MTFHRKKVLPRKSRFYLWEFVGIVVGIVVGNCENFVGKCEKVVRIIAGILGFTISEQNKRRWRMYFIMWFET